MSVPLLENFGTPISTTLNAIENAGWEIVDVEAWRIHYAKTLRHWLANLDKVIDRAANLIGERRLQLWRIYLLGCALSFERNKIGIYQTLLRRKADREWNLPLTRLAMLIMAINPSDFRGKAFLPLFIFFASSLLLQLIERAVLLKNLVLALLKFLDR